MDGIMEALPQPLVFILANLIWINIALSFGIIFIERRDPTTTLLWIMVLNFLPGIGFLLYLYFGKNVTKSKLFRRKEDKEKEDQVAIHEQLIRMERDEMNYKSPWIKDHEDLIKLHLLAAHSLYTDNNEVKLYFDGLDLFKQLAADLERAQNSIDIEFYIFKSDEVGQRILELIEKKSKQGVQVRLLMDGMGGRFFEREWKKRLADAGVHIAVFFPASLPIVNVRINYRNHRKIVVIDGKIGYIGGFNVGNEYLSLSKRMGYWRDTHLRLEGNAINDLWKRFFYDFQFAENYRENIKMPNFKEERPSNGHTGINIVTSGPDSPWQNIRNGYARMINSAKERVWIQTPYFIPDSGLMNSLKTAALTGLDVRLMIPNKPDHPFVYWATLNFSAELLDAGVRVFTYERGFLHTKAMLIDNTVVSIGTANFDIRSFKLNFEINAFIYDRAINEIVANQYMEDLMFCEELTKEKYAQRSNWIKIKESISRLLAPIL